MNMESNTPSVMKSMTTPIDHKTKEVEVDTSSGSVKVMLVDHDIRSASLPSLSQPTETTTMDPDSMDTMLSFLTLSDYCNLSVVSRRMNVAVSTSSHLFMLTACNNHIVRRNNCYRLRRHDGSNNDNRSNNIPQINHTTPQEHAIENSSSLRQFNSGSSEFLTSSSKQQDLVTLLDRFQNLRVLNLHGPPLTGAGDELIGILNACPASRTLQSITLHGCRLSYWCAQSLRIPNLHHLTFTGGNSIRARISFLLKDSRQLKTLTLKECPSVRDEDIYELSRLLHDTLEGLTLNLLKILRPKTLMLPRLNRLSLTGCFSLMDVCRLHCPTLTELNISFCVRLTGEQIQCMVERLPSLETLIMMKCSAVRTLEVNSNTLRVLILSYSHSLQRLRLVCPLLEQLEVGRKNRTRTVIMM